MHSIALVRALLEKLSKASLHHPAVTGVRELPDFSAALSAGGLVEKVGVLIEHMPFVLGRPRRLKGKDPRRSPDPGADTWAMPLLFQRKPGVERVFSPDVLFHLRKRVPLTGETKVRMDRLARATALRLLAEDMGLSWKDGRGFAHERSGVQFDVGFEPAPKPTDSQ